MLPTLALFLKEPLAQLVTLAIRLAPIGSRDVRLERHALKAVAKGGSGTI